MPIKKRSVNQIVNNDGTLNVVAFVSYMQELTDLNQAIFDRLENVDRNIAALSGETDSFLRRHEFHSFYNKEYTPLSLQVVSLNNWKLRVIAYGTAFGAFMGFVGPLVIGWLEKTFL